MTARSTKREKTLPGFPAAQIGYLTGTILPSVHAVIAAGHSATFVLLHTCTHPGIVKRLVLIAPTWRGPLPTMVNGRRPVFDHICRVVDLPSPPAPVYNWTGWYLGGDLGGSWGDAPTDIAGIAHSQTGAGAGAGAGFPPATLPFADSNTARLHGIIGGGQLGYNYQVGPQWVLGFEADIQASGERGNNTFVDPLSGIICVGAGLNVGCIETEPVSGAAVTFYAPKIEWFGTVRGRVGMLLNDGLLLYGTGGLAYGQVSVSGNVNESVSFPGSFGICCIRLRSQTTFSQSTTNIGFAAGGGLEGRLAPWFWPNWTWKLEYLYVDLGSLDMSTPLKVASDVPATGIMTMHTHFTDNIVRVG